MPQPQVNGHRTQIAADGTTAPKTAIKTAKPSPRSGVALPLGAHPKNTGGKKGRSGRPPVRFVELARKALESPKTQAEFLAALEDRTTPGYAALVKTIAAYLDGLPVQPVQLTGSADSPLTIRVVDR